MSTLLSAMTTLRPANRAASSSSQGRVASTIQHRRSTSAIAASAAATMRRFSSERGPWRPGVSTSTAWRPGTVTTPITRVRVVCGLGLTAAIDTPTSWLSRVLFPALGRPTSATVPA